MRKPIVEYLNFTKMKEEIFEQLNRIERNSLLAAKNVLTFDDLVLITGFSRSYLYKKTCANEIPHFKPKGKMLFFDRKEIEDWLRQNKIATKDEIDRKGNKIVMGL